MIIGPHPEELELPDDPDERFTFARELVRRAMADADPEAAFAVARYNLLRTGADFEAAGDRWFAKAVELGGNAMAWRAATIWFDLGRPVRYRDWMARAITAEFPLASAPGIDVDPKTLGPYPFDDEDHLSAANTSLQIRGADNAEAAAAALAAAADRLGTVNESGRETTMAQQDGIMFTPGWVSPVRDEADGPFVMFDTKSQMWGPMARAMIRIVIEELAAAGVRTAVVGPAPE
jgi:TPR repeat protein